MIPNDVNAARFLLHLLTVLRTNIVATPEKNQIYNSLKNDVVIESLSGYLTGDCPAAAQWPTIGRELKRKQREGEERMNEQIRNDPECKHRPQLLSHERISIPTLAEVAIEIFSLSVEHSPALLRHALLSQVSTSGAPTLWFALCEMFRTNDNPGLQIQLSEIFRKVLDPITLDDAEKDDLLSKFYDHHVVDRLIDIVLTPPPQTFEDLFPEYPELASPYFISDEFSEDEREDEEQFSASECQPLVAPILPSDTSQRSYSPTATMASMSPPCRSSTSSLHADADMVELISGETSPPPSSLTPTRSVRFALLVQSFFRQQYRLEQLALLVRNAHLVTCH